eukprot:1157823-Pelagomonas_calceolata.AAC.5
MWSATPRARSIAASITSGWTRLSGAGVRCTRAPHSRPPASTALPSMLLLVCPSPLVLVAAEGVAGAWCATRDKPRGSMDPTPPRRPMHTSTHPASPAWSQSG